MSTDSPIHLLADPPAEPVAVPVTVVPEPRPLTADERLRVQALRLPFTEARRKVITMVPTGNFCALAMRHLRDAEAIAVEALEAAMREGR